MHKLTSKLETASSLVKQGDWSRLGQKAQRNIATVTDPLLETATLLRNAYVIGSILDGRGFTIRNTAGQEHREDRYFEQNWGWTYGQDRRFLTLDEQRDASLDFVQRAAPQGAFMLFMRSLYTHFPRYSKKEHDCCGKYATALRR